MHTRKEFLRNALVAGCAIPFISGKDFLAGARIDDFSFTSPFIRVGLRRTYPAFSFFATDSLGQGRLHLSPILTEPPRSKAFTARTYRDSISYFNSPEDIVADWQVKCEEKKIDLISRKPGAEPFEISFSRPQNHATVLGIMREGQRVLLPCILHLPGLGTFIIESRVPDATIFYDVTARESTGETPFVKLRFDGAGAKGTVKYSMRSVTLFPRKKKIHRIPLFDGYRRNFINIFQLNPRLGMLANSSSGDARASTLFLYAEVARVTPPLTKTFTAMDLIRDSLETYISGKQGYGHPGWSGNHESLDSRPSLIIAASYYIKSTSNREWAQKNYPAIKKWGEEMMRKDSTGNGLIEYGYSGNSGSWDSKIGPANWWHTIGFGHEDAYSNILCYRACSMMSDEKIFPQDEHTRACKAFAEKTKQHFFTNFYNPETGVLAGWKSGDGKLHDYYFTFVNSMAIHCGLVDKVKGKEILTKLLEKMKEVGFVDFKSGLPGNLIPIHPSDSGSKEGFQIYQNGGVSGCFAYYFIYALILCELYKPARELLLGMMDSYAKNEFEGKCPNTGMTRVWKTWNGECRGHEGFLADSYHALLVVEGVDPKIPFLNELVHFLNALTVS
ncbi:MAG: hypothetical protein H7Y27_15795 [Gemmatimonadaceae bacterium]|nr:hypothetical protein [Chitinophagaceae bacterium]